MPELQPSIQGSVDVLLVSMPFGPITQPSLGLSLLKRVLAREHLTADILYATLRFADMIGGDTYTQISSGDPYVDLAGEWVFSNALFDGQNEKHIHYIDDVLRRQSPHNNRKASVPEHHIDALRFALESVEPFLAQIVDDICARQPAIVGLTSVFQQHVASLCLAKRLKEANSNLFIVMGGGNCENMMGVETVRQFKSVDAVVSGEAEGIFPDLVRRVLDGTSIDVLQGVITRRNLDDLGDKVPVAPMVCDLDTLPLIDFDDFFDQLHRSSVSRIKNMRILFETSRGCWWGERSQCMFCGLNGDTITYRSKSPERAFDELEALLKRYPDYPVWVVDNILNMRYFDDFVPRLGTLNRNVELFYEVKANLRKSQLMQLRDAGIRQVQPGIESLSDRLLRLMRKGVSALQNIQVLKWCKELGLDVYWNILWGFPDERAEDYEQIRAMLPLLYHLQPPISMAQIRLDRFSPFFEDPPAHGFANVRPAIPYEYIYALAPVARYNLAYHFFYDYQPPRDVHAYTQPLFRDVKRWRCEYERSDLLAVDLESHLLLWDLRTGAAHPLTVLSGAARAVYLFCDQVRTRRRIEAFAELPPTDLDDTLRFLTERQIMITSGEAFLSLGVRPGIYTPPLAVLQKLKEVVVDLDMTLERRTRLDSRSLDMRFFAIDDNGKPFVYFEALCALIDQAIIWELTQPLHQTIAGITIDI
ncbi:MAG TPA: RiPP maturation radical SAM C-methyltransferase [Aggregatilineaceae bacterium]|nr:RiPP maturation radical SAM C-methyltransferase [Aggregatilineaceae bacterium]